MRDPEAAPAEPVEKLRSRQAEQREGVDPVGEAAPAEPVQSQHGQVVPLMAVAIVLVAALALGVAGLGRRSIARARAQSAADSAALAAAVAIPPVVARDVAERFAARNGATLVGWRTVGPTVVVTVEVAGEHATAAARPATTTVRPPPDR
jgi:secretion/DNA translocation related TadE-like protein